MEFKSISDMIRFALDELIGNDMSFPEVIRLQRELKTEIWRIMNPKPLNQEGERIPVSSGWEQGAFDSELWFSQWTHVALMARQITHYQ